jgi:hypothetical protein
VLVFFKFHLQATKPVPPFSLSRMAHCAALTWVNREFESALANGLGGLMDTEIFRWENGTGRSRKLDNPCTFVSSPQSDDSGLPRILRTLFEARYSLVHCGNPTAAKTRAPRREPRVGPNETRVERVQ